MTDGVDTHELLERIRRARDWAASESERAPSDGRSSADGRTFHLVRQVLDEILEPGKHSNGS